MNEYIFSMQMSAYDVEHYYYAQGGSNVVVTTNQGVRVQIAMRNLVPFITRDGIKGWFRLRTTAEHKFVSLEKLS
ncbi:DUF2835 family protein [Aliidiomarina celeris]|uniref:DUF2835 family protein n=1 Tax=Aliidiomarina celeris TaxID=2249428 RepID=UPI000DE80A3B|nr:DUF2835 family protein [Aliidiomarina celeris]